MLADKNIYMFSYNKLCNIFHHSNMKKHNLTFLIVLFTLNIYSQEIIKLSNGKEILIYPDKTWDYKPIEKDTIPRAIKISLSSITRVFTLPSKESIELNNFNKNDVELLSYSNDFFKIKSKLNEIGYVRDYDIGIDEMFKYQAMFNEQDIISAKDQNKNLFIRGTSVTDINSAGGVSFSIDFGYFSSKKKIKYLYFTVVPYNNVGDMQICSVNRSSTLLEKLLVQY